MEVSMHDLYTKNKGVVQMYLNNSLYVDFSENLEDNFSKLLHLRTFKMPIFKCS